MTTYIGQPADQYWFTSPSSAATPGRCEERGRPDGQSGSVRAGGYDIGFHYICTDNLLGEESVPRERSAILF